IGDHGSASGRVDGDRGAATRVVFVAGGPPGGRRNRGDAPGEVAAEFRESAVAVDEFDGATARVIGHEFFAAVGLGASVGSVVFVSVFRGAFEGPGFRRDAVGVLVCRVSMDSGRRSDAGELLVDVVVTAPAAPGRIGEFAY